MGETKRRLPELVIGLISAFGARVEDVSAAVTEIMQSADYEVHEVRLSDLINAEYGVTSKAKNRMSAAAAMDHGTQLREETKLGWAVAALGMREIARIRSRARTREPRGVCYVLRSLKHPDEIRRLRHVYGDHFLAVSVYTPRPERMLRLMQQFANADGGRPAQQLKAVTELIDRDQREDGRELGQRVRDAFPLSDVVISTSAEAEPQVRRWFDILFQKPVVTPTRDESGMFHAFAASLSSAALGRQVGAAITTPDGELLAVGCNEVARAGGGPYRHGDHPDGRDFRIGFDQSDLGKKNALREIVKSLVPRVTEERFDKIREALADSILMSLTEFTRDVHAETSALLSAARRGAPTQGATLYVTAFPCHGCAKHIVAAGIRRVVYIEPYPKSYVAEFYRDSISLEGDDSAGRVPFETFAGVAPRYFIDAFQAVAKRRDAEGRTPAWIRGTDTALRRFGAYDLASSGAERERQDINRVKVARTNARIVQPLKANGPSGKSPAVGRSKGEVGDGRRQAAKKPRRRRGRSR